MSTIELLENLTKNAANYRKDAQKSLERNRHMNEIEEGEQVQQRVIDAVLTDYINFIASKYMVDYALYTTDLRK